LDGTPPPPPLKGWGFLVSFRGWSFISIILMLRAFESSFGCDFLGPLILSFFLTSSSPRIGFPCSPRAEDFFHWIFASWDFLSKESSSSVVTRRYHLYTWLPPVFIGGHHLSQMSVFDSRCRYSRLLLPMLGPRVENFISLSCR